MAKTVEELAKELDMESEALLQFCQKNDLKNISNSQYQLVPIMEMLIRKKINPQQKMFSVPYINVPELTKNEMQQQIQQEIFSILQSLKEPKLKNTITFKTYLAVLDMLVRKLNDFSNKDVISNSLLLQSFLSLDKLRSSLWEDRLTLISEIENLLKTYFKLPNIIDPKYYLKQKNKSQKFPLYIEPHNQLKPLTLLIDPGEATSEELSELFIEFSTLYRMFGGSGINFKITDVKEFSEVLL